MSCEVKIHSHANEIWKQWRKTCKFAKQMIWRMMYLKTVNHRCQIPSVPQIIFNITETVANRFGSGSSRCDFIVIFLSKDSFSFKCSFKRLFLRVFKNQPRNFFHKWSTQRSEAMLFSFSIISFQKRMKRFFQTHWE